MGVPCDLGLPKELIGADPLAVAEYAKGQRSGPTRTLLRQRNDTWRLMPGLVVVATGVGCASALNRVLPSVGVLVAAIGMGVAASNLMKVRESLEPGIRFAARRLLRIGVVLLGLQISVPQIVNLGGGLLLVVIGTVLVTFMATRWLARRLGLSEGLGFLMAAGFSICGASAVAAMSSATDSDEDEVATAVAMVTLYGTVAMLALPLLANPLELSGVEFGAWSGASIHEVAQVVGAAATVPGALAVAIVVKLTRVMMLAPLLAVVVYTRSRRSSANEGRRPAAMPLFVAGFVGMVILRSTGLMPADALDAARLAQTLLLAAAMFGLGYGVRLVALLRNGSKALVLGLGSTCIVVASSLLGLAVLSGLAP